MDSIESSLSVESPVGSEFVAETGELGGDVATETPKIEENQAELINHGKQLPFSCITFARAHSKVGQPPKVDFAKNLLNNQSSPVPGYWVIFGEGFFGTAGHTGIIEKFEGYELTFRGFNYPYGQERVMTIDIRDKRYNLKGFFADIE